MRAVFGLLLIMLGLAMAVVWMPEHDGERQLVAVTDIATQGISNRAEQGDRSGGRTFSPQTPLLATVETPGRTPQHTAGVARLVAPPVQPLPVTEVVPQLSATAGVSTGAAPGASVVGPALAVVRPVEPGRAGAVQEMPRDELVRTLQRELRRVGCYAGEVDGDWGSGSRRAMTTFTDRVNATLPVDQPDHVLLSLLKTQSGTVCVRTCPAGQLLADNGRCLTTVAARRHQERGANREATREAEREIAAAQPPAQDSGAITRMMRSAPVTTASAPAASPTGSTPGGSLDSASTPGAAGAPSANAPVAAAPPALTVAAVTVPAGRLPSGAAVESPSTAPSMPSPAARQAARMALPESAGVEPPRPAAPSAARQAVRAASEPERERVRPQRERAPRAAAARRSTPARFAGPQIVVYRVPARVVSPAYYASAPRRSSRSWTATFFGSP